MLHSIGLRQVFYNDVDDGKSSQESFESAPFLFLDLLLELVLLRPRSEPSYLTLHSSWSGSQDHWKCHGWIWMS